MSNDHNDVTPPYDPRQLDGRGSQDAGVPARSNAASRTSDVPQGGDFPHDARATDAGSERVGGGAAGDLQGIVTFGASPGESELTGLFPSGGSAATGVAEAPSDTTDRATSEHEYRHAAAATAAGDPALAASGLNAGSADGPRPVLASSSIEFRVFRDGSPVRRLRLGGQRYTFGSGEGCSIRLNDAALRPMHAVLVRDAGRIVLRAYSVPVLVNGQRRSESTLAVGDIVTMGGYRFELVSVAAPNPGGIHPQAHSVDAHAHSSSLSHGAAPADFARSAPIQHSSVQYPSAQSASAPYPPAQYAAGSGQDASLASQAFLTEQLRREAELWRKRQQDTERRDARCDQRETSLFSRENELWTRAEQLQSRESALKSQESAALQIQDEFLRKQAELEQIRTATSQREAAFSQRESEFRRVEAEYQNQLERATTQLQQSQDQATAATQAVVRMREQFASLNGQLESLTRQQQEVERQDTQRFREQEERRRQLEHARDEALAQRNQAHHERDQAIDGIARSEAKRRQTEQQLRDSQAALEAEREEFAAEKKRLADQAGDSSDLAAQIEQLNAAVESAQNETTLLRSQYADAVQAIAELERLNGELEASGQTERTAWSIETDELRETVNQLRDDLKSANGELESLRSTNDNLVSQVESLTQEVGRAEDRAAQEAGSPSDVCRNLQEELSRANSQLCQLKGVYDATLAEIDQNALAKSAQPDSGSQATPAASINELATRFDAKAAELAVLLRGLTDDESADASRPVSLVSQPPEDFVPTAERRAAAESDTPQPGDDQPPRDTPEPESSVASLAAGATAIESTPAPATADATEWRSVAETRPVEPSSVGVPDPGYGEPKTAGFAASVADAAQQNPAGVPTDEVVVGGDVYGQTSNSDPGYGEPADVTGYDFGKPGNDDLSQTEAATAPPIDFYAATNKGQLTPAAQTSATQTPADEREAAWPSQQDAARSANEGASVPAEEPVQEAPVQEAAWSQPEAPEPVAQQQQQQPPEPQPIITDAEQKVEQVEASWADATGYEDAISVGNGYADLGTAASETGTPAYETPAYETPAYETPAQETPAYDAPSNDAPSNDAASAYAKRSQDDDAEDDDSIGSLASLLINDIDNDSQGDSRASDSYAAPQEAHKDNAFQQESASSASGEASTVGQEAEAADWSSGLSTQRFADSSDDVGQSAEDHGYSGGDDSGYSYASNGDDSSTTSGADDSLSPSQLAMLSASSEQLRAEPERSEPERYESQPAAAGGDVEDEDDSVEAYMNRLLGRMNSDSSDSSSTDSAPAQPPTPSPAPAKPESSYASSASVAQPEPASEPEPELPPIAPDEPLQPRSQAPEGQSMSAMRELANQTARSAISRSSKTQNRQTQVRALSKFGQGGVALLCGLAAFVFVSGFLKVIAAGAAVLIAFVCVNEGLALLNHSGGRPGDAKPGDGDNSAPAA